MKNEAFQLVQFMFETNFYAFYSSQIAVLLESSALFFFIG